MFYEACQGRLQQKLIITSCPECGAELEMAATDPFGICEECGAEVLNESMDCIFWCDNAVNCIGEEAYKKARESRDFIEIGEDFHRPLW